MRYLMDARIQTETEKEKVMRKTVAIVFLIFGTLASAATAQTNALQEAPSRTWMSVNGNTVTAAFVREEDGKVYLKTEAGKTVATSRAKLSPNDLAWIDSFTQKPDQGKTVIIPKATRLEMNKMEQYRKMRRLIIKTYTELTNNDREDKHLAFLERDALSMYGWQSISSDCYVTKSGKRGKIREMTFLPQSSMSLKEAAQVVRDKFVLPLGEQTILKEVTHRGERYWEVQGLPAYVERFLLLADSDPETVERFDLFFPPPDAKK